MTSESAKKKKIELLASKLTIFFFLSEAKTSFLCVIVSERNTDLQVVQINL